MKDEGAPKKFRADLGRKGVHPLCFLKSVEVVDLKGVASMQKTGVGKVFSFSGLDGVGFRTCVCLPRWVRLRLGERRGEGDRPADKVMPFFSAS